MTLIAALVVPLAAACVYRTPAAIDRWQDPSPSVLSLRAKAQAYQDRLERRHQMPDGLIRYKRRLGGEPESGYGNLADGSFFLGIYLASQALRYAKTHDPVAKQQLELSLGAMQLYAEVSGKRGLLARYFSPVAPADLRWRPSPTHPGYFWRSDVSKDQYAGFVHGLAVTWAVVSDSEIRAKIAPLAAALADHLMDHELRIVDWDGERTTHGDLRGRILGFPIGVNALISLATAKLAAESSSELRYRDFYDRLVEEGYPGRARWASVPIPGKENRVNEHMAYLALYPLLLLERDETIAAPLRRGAQKLWARVRDDRNAFFAFVNAGVAAGASSEGRRVGRESLREFPDEKVGWPVDLTREGFDLPRGFLNRLSGEPRSTRSVPLYLRPRSSSFWTSDPRRLVGRLGDRGDLELAGVDYLIAYWLGRYHDLIEPHE